MRRRSAAGVGPSRLQDCFRRRALTHQLLSSPARSHRVASRNIWDSLKFMAGGWWLIQTKSAWCRQGSKAGGLSEGSGVRDAARESASGRAGEASKEPRGRRNKAAAVDGHGIAFERNSLAQFHGDSQAEWPSRFATQHAGVPCYDSRLVSKRSLIALEG